MAPTGVTDRAFPSNSRGLTITSAVVKKGRPTLVKYSWTYNPKKSPGEFSTAVFNIETKEQTFLGDSVITREHGKKNTGTFTLDITYLKNKPGKYLLLFMLVDEEPNEVIAKSKPFEVKKSDF